MAPGSLHGDLGGDESVERDLTAERVDYGDLVHYADIDAVVADDRLGVYPVDGSVNGPLGADGESVYPADSHRARQFDVQSGSRQADVPHECFDSYSGGFDVAGGIGYVLHADDEATIKRFDETTGAFLGQYEGIGTFLVGDGIACRTNP